MSCIGAESMLTHLCTSGLVFLTFKSLTERLTLESQRAVTFLMVNCWCGKKIKKTQLSWFGNTTGYIWGGEFELFSYWPKHCLFPQNYIVTDWIYCLFTLYIAYVTSVKECFVMFNVFLFCIFKKDQKINTIINRSFLLSFLIYTD